MVKLNKIYTRTGDDGTSGLVNGSRCNKAAPRFQAIGSVDELNSALGLAAVALTGSEHAAALARVQNDLFDLGADLATPGEMAGALRILPAQVAWLEERIDHLNAALAPLTSFILPAGEPAAAALHLARAVTRRAERSAVAAGAGAQPVANLNRLSDLLFVAARAANLGGAGEVLWVPGASRT